jgi:hypothetical protein
MKKKMFFIPVLLVMFLFIFSVQQVVAADPVWATVSIERVGQNGTQGAGVFTHETTGTPIFTGQYFTFNDSAKKELLATALTALSLGKTLKIKFENGTNVIDIMWIYNE